MEVRGHLHTLTALPPAETASSTHWTGDWVGPRLRRHKHWQTEKFTPVLCGEFGIFCTKELRIYINHPEEIAGNCEQWFLAHKSNLCTVIQNLEVRKVAACWWQGFKNCKHLGELSWHVVNNEQKTKPSFEANTASITLSHFLDCNQFVLLYRSICFHFTYLTFF